MPISQVVRAWGNLPMSFTVMMRWREDLSSFTASSWGMLRKLLPFTSRIWSPTCGVRPSIKPQHNRARVKRGAQATGFSLKGSHQSRGHNPAPCAPRSAE
uniref:Uncharacterized protein n=1 Tax=Dromaius novaehollandiae TaxID=8790 RepID=A0A8C4KUB3_DRONO